MIFGLEAVIRPGSLKFRTHHTRHIFLKERGLDFIELSKQGLDLVVIRVEIDYLYPLHLADRFYVG